MNSGTVKYFNESKRFGVIIDDETGIEHHVHSTDLINDISQGDKVEFELREISKGHQVVNVKSV